jgi:adenylate kinase
LEDLLILNGIPRHAGQAHDMAEILTIHALVVLDFSADVVYYRLRENNGGDRDVRQNDGVALVQKKLALFHERTRLLVEHFKRLRSNVSHFSVDDQTTVDEIYTSLSSLPASDPPVSFVTKPPQR